ncbi:hydrolase [Maliponia aquimaris]|uniref:Uncharacterized protein n=1 Tax=Maliponia aquimaris TaxID=1673631 RepID=A0A238KF75_9RHOB|nr:hydrolase [Maliponia aquimaris]SMX40762.1 hypothetical protein MAA8898_02244 [Maliponia aquimaris]
MEVNRLPHYDMSVNTTGCCPRFNPQGWDGQQLRFRDKPFVRADTMALMHLPVNMGRVFSRVLTHMQAAGTFDTDNYIVLSRDTSPWHAQHLFAAASPVPDEAMTTLSGDFVTKVFEGPYRDVRKWHAAMQEAVRAKGRQPGDVWFFYTTCPKCAKAYGKNHVVGVAEMT